MKQFSLKRMGLKLAMAAVLVLPELAGAQTFIYSQNGDVVAGFRKTGSFKGNYELVVNLGNIVTNFINVPSGTTINITNFSNIQLTNAFMDTSSGYGNLQWSVFTTLLSGSLNGSYTFAPYTFPNNTLWLTVPGTNVNTQTTPPFRNSGSTQSGPRSQMVGVGGSGSSTGAGYISAALPANATNNTAFLVREPESGYTLHLFSTFIDNGSYNFTSGDFSGTSGGSGGLGFSVENVTPAPFTSAQRSDFYQLCPSGKTDPINNSTTTTYFVGYFILNPNGTMTFTRAAAAGAAPVASFGGTPTNGVAPLSVTFTDASTGSGITNWIWNLGDGTSVTNSTSASVNHSYAAGTYTVSLTVNNPGGSSLVTSNNYIVVTNSAPAAPVAAFTGSPTNIFATQTVTFTNISTGSITNWVWSFGDGSAAVTNATGANVNHAYAVAGTNTVSLIVNGAGGSSTNTRAGYIAVLSAKAVFSGGSSPTSFGAGKFGFNGTGGPVGVQYRVLTQTNVAQSLANWTPIYTNVFGANGSYSYTNSTLVGNQGYLILVSP